MGVTACLHSRNFNFPEGEVEIKLGMSDYAISWSKISTIKKKKNTRIEL